MKLNCDMGESFGVWVMGQDEAIMPFIDMANIACGFHASDPQIMQQTITLASKHQVMIGAHPSYPDLAGFGRRAMSYSAAELVNIVLYQIGALQALCEAQGVSLAYIKPHGALYNTMMEDTAVYTAIVEAVSRLAKPVPLMIMATKDPAYREIAARYHVKLLFEAFCDRAYTDAGLLQARSIQGAVYDSVDAIVSQAQQLIQHQTVTTVSGNTLSIEADTLCIHGDGPLALPCARAIREFINTL